MNRLTWRIWKAIIFSAAVPALPLLFLFPPIGFGVFIYAFLIALVIAFPAFLVLRNFSVVSERTCAQLVGTAAGALFSAFFFGLFEQGWLKILGVGACFAALGCLAGFVFWYSGIRQPNEETI